MTNPISIKSLVLDKSHTIRMALAVIEQGEMGACFVMDGPSLLGLLTDGDIRRAILSGASLDDSIIDFVVRDFVSVSPGSSIEAIQDKLRDSSIKFMPVVNDAGELVDIIRSNRYHQTPLVTLSLDGNELDYVTDCILSGWISSQGKYVRQFEENFAELVGTTHAVAVSNGTDAIELALLAVGIGRGDEVIVPNLTFAATINAVINVGATPVLVDVNPISFGLSPDKVRSAVTSQTKAIIAVHLYGHHCDIEAIVAVAADFDLKVIEDCAEAIGTRVGNKHVGSFGDASTFSFFGNKTITTGEGGMLCLNVDEYHSIAKQIRDHGMSTEKRYWHDMVGHNYRMTNLQAAIGCAQLERVDKFLQRKQDIADSYDRHLSGIEGISLPNRPSNAINSIWLYTILLPQGYGEHKDKIIADLLESGIESRGVFYPLNAMPVFQSYVIDGEAYKESCDISARGMSLPTSLDMSEGDVTFVCDALRKCLEKYTEN